MAKIKALPGQDTIDGFKGTLDFYVYMGVACVRSWPKSPGHDRAPEVQKHWPAFAWAASNWNEMSPYVRKAYEDLARGTIMTARDLFTKSFINGSTLYLEGV